MYNGGTQKLTFKDREGDPREYAAMRESAVRNAKNNASIFGIPGVQEASVDSPGNIPAPGATPTSGSAADFQSGTTDVDQDPSGVQADKRLEERLALYARAGSKGGSNAYTAPSRERMT